MQVTSKKQLHILGGYTWLSCGGHVLNLVAQAGFDTAGTKKIITGCKSFVTFFKKIITAANELHSQQTRMNHKVLSLIQECCTRWWSILDMICRILEIKDPLNATLGQKIKTDLILSASDAEKLQAVAMLMGIFQTYSTMLSGQ